MGAGCAGFHIIKFISKLIKLFILYNCPKLIYAVWLYQYLSSGYLIKKGL